MCVISIGLKSVYYETDFEEISYDNLLKLKKLYDEEGEKAVLKYVYSALRCMDDPEGLFNDHEPTPYLSIREYGMDGLYSIRVYEDDELIDELFEEVKNVKIAKRKEVDEFTKFCKGNGPRFIVGYRTYCDREHVPTNLIRVYNHQCRSTISPLGHDGTNFIRVYNKDGELIEEFFEEVEFGEVKNVKRKRRCTESIARIDSSTFDIKKLELLPSFGFDEEKYTGGDISIDPVSFIYDGKVYCGDEDGFINPFEVFGVIVDENGKADTSFLEKGDFKGFLTKATNP